MKIRTFSTEVREFRDNLKAAGLLDDETRALAVPAGMFKRLAAAYLTEYTGCNVAARRTKSNDQLEDIFS